ncbi:conserved protein of unknown function [Magnetospirillum sp. XM-1]|uniref:hypothetical protein n=1 Tax=Magnetospirillum sp. XM-1 TaxID=1663591 RepID=UPI00073DFE7E|nr:hypothetical protein [Magnetospirillum sp. XM-1]CUW37526.1 conserved protein of unknown function [Magnetospirillum sp. XM-1]
MLQLKFSDEKKILVSEARKKTPRQVVLDGIQNQVELLKNPGFTVERVRYSKGAENGNTRQSISRPPQPWFWRSAKDGNLLLEIRYGRTPVELQGQGMANTVIAGKTPADAIKVLEQIATAVKAGELDEPLEAARIKAKHRRGKSE